MISVISVIRVLLRAMFKEFADYIKEKTHLDLVIHKDPDGDAIGSALALRLILKEKGIDSDIYCQTMD